MSNPSIMVDGITREMTDAEAAAHQAEQDAYAASLVTPQALLDYAASVRYTKEIAGVTCTVGSETNVPVSTDRGNDRSTLIAEFVAIGGGLRTDGEPYKFNDGITRYPTNAEMMAACQAALAHIKACFAMEGTVQAGINANPPTITSRQQIDAAFSG